MAERTAAEITAQIQSLRELREATDDLVKKEVLRTEIMEEQVALLKALGDEGSRYVINLKNQIRVSKELAESLQKQAAAGEAVAEGLGALVGLNKDFESSMLGSLSTTLSSAVAWQKFRGQLKKTFTVQNWVYSILLKIQQATTDLMTKQDSALVSFNKQTGAARIYGSELVALEENLYTHGVSMADAAEAGGALVRTVYGLKTISKSSRKDLMTTTAILQELGVSADTTGANVQFMTRALGMSVRKSATYQRELFTLAQQIGMPPQEMAEGFKSAQPKLAAFGKDAGRVFKKLATAARASGMEIQQMLAIVEQFDTFEGASTAVGKLNALLGGPFLNSMEMVMQTDPTERMRMLGNALNRAGKSFDQMTYYEKKSIAAAAGLSDVSELALIMAGNFNGVAGGAQKSQAEILRLAAQTKEMNEIWDELNQIIRMFAIQMRPVMESLKEGIEYFQENKDAVKKLIPWVTGLAGAFFGVRMAFNAMALAGVTGWAAVLGPLIVIPGAITAGIALAQMFDSVEIGILGAAGAGLLLAAAFGVVTGPIALIVGGIALATAALWRFKDSVASVMNTLFFTNIGHSNMLEGMEQMGGAANNLAAGYRRTRVESDALNRSFKATSVHASNALESDALNRSFKATSVHTSNALTNANSAATTTSPTYSQLKNRVLMGSKSGATSSSPKEIEVKISLDSMFKRYFTADVLEIVGGRKSPLNTVTEGNA